MTLLMLHGLAKASIFQGRSMDLSALTKKVLHTRNNRQDQDRVIFSRRMGFPEIVTKSFPVLKFSPKSCWDPSGDVSCCLPR